MVKIIPLKETHKEKYLKYLSDHSDIPQGMFNLELLPFGAEILICLDEDENILGVCRTSYTGVVAEEALDYVFVSKEYRRDENGTLLVVAVMQRAVNRLIARYIVLGNAAKPHRAPLVMVARKPQFAYIRKGFIFLNRLVVKMTMIVDYRQIFNRRIYLFALSFAKI